MKKLLELHDTIRKCQKCEKLCPWKKFKDEDYGNLNSKLMLIGEAPGERAIDNNLTWSGPAGKRLRKIVSPMGKLEDIFYLSNVLKCLPPGNRDPHSNEIKNCSSYLLKEIELINPTIIFVVGRFATDLVFDIFEIEKQSITQIHMKEFKINGTKIVPILHPSYASVWSKTYNEDVRKLVKKHIKL